MDFGSKRCGLRVKALWILGLLGIVYLLNFTAIVHCPEMAFYLDLNTEGHHTGYTDLPSAHIKHRNSVIDFSGKCLWLDLVFGSTLYI